MRHALHGRASGLTLAVLSLALGCSTDGTAPQDPGSISLIIVSGNNQSGVVGKELPLPLVVKATNPNGSVIANLTVDFKVTSGNGSTYVVATSTNTSGVARNFWTLGTSIAVAHTIQVRAILANGTKQVLGTFSATPLAGPATLIVAQTGDGQVAPAGTPVAIAPSVLVTDQYGNPVKNLAVTFAVASGGGSVTGASAQTTSAGIATVGSWTLGPTAGGANTLTATVAGLAGSPVTFSATAANGFALSFDGTNDIATVLDAPILNPASAITLEFWVSFGAIAQGQYGVAKDNGLSRQFFLGLNGPPGPGPTGQFRTAIATTSGLHTLDGGTVVSATNVWHHVAMTYDGSVLRLYLDGQLDGSSLINEPMIAGTVPLTFGNNAEVVYPLFGTLDEVRLWSVARSQAEIQASMGKILPGTQSGLIGYWRFEEGAGDSATDETGGGNNALLGTASGADIADPTWLHSQAPVTP